MDSTAETTSKRIEIEEGRLLFEKELQPDRQKRGIGTTDKIKAGGSRRWTKRQGPNVSRKQIGNG